MTETPMIIGWDLGSQETAVYGFNFGQGLQMVSMPVGIRPREGTVYSDAGERMPLLKVKNGRLIAKAGDVWHIITAF